LASRLCGSVDEWDVLRTPDEGACRLRSAAVAKRARQVVNQHKNVKNDSIHTSPVSARRQLLSNDENKNI